MKCYIFTYLYVDTTEPDDKVTVPEVDPLYDELDKGNTCRFNDYDNLCTQSLQIWTCIWIWKNISLQLISVHFHLKLFHGPRPMVIFILHHK